MIPVNDRAQKSRLLTSEELGLVVKFQRELRQWSQEQLGELSGVSTRTIQLVEAGKPSDLDTRRALARAFEVEDIDAFNKPYVIPTEDELNVAKEKVDKESITLQALPLSTGNELAGLVESASMDLSTPTFELCREADGRFAELVDYFRDYRDCADIYSQRDKFSHLRRLSRTHRRAQRTWGCHCATQPAEWL